MKHSATRVIYAAMAGNALIAITKFIAAAFTGSSAMLAEGIHSVVDTGNQLLMLYGLKRAKLPADEYFPFGHGKEIYFWSFIVAIMIFAVGAGVSIYQGIQHVLQPLPLSDVWISYTVLGLAMVFEGGAWYVAFKEFKRHIGHRSYLQAVRQGKDPTLFVILFEDSAAMLGLVVAFIGIFLAEYTGILWFDGAASIVIGCILGGTAIWLAYETKSLLIGESADPEVIDDIRRMIADYDEIEYINEILTLHMGPDYILVTISVDFRDTTQAGKVENINDKLDKAIKQAWPKVKRVFIEAEARK